MRVGQLEPPESNQENPDFLPLHSVEERKEEYKKAKRAARAVEKHKKKERHIAYLYSKPAWHGMKDYYKDVDWHQIRNQSGIAQAQERAESRGVERGDDVELDEDEAEELAQQTLADQNLTGIVEGGKCTNK